MKEIALTTFSQEYFLLMYNQIDYMNKVIDI